MRIPGLDGWTRLEKMECFRGDVRFAKYALADLVGEFAEETRRGFGSLVNELLVSADEGGE